MSVGRFASAIVVGMMAGGLTAMSGIGRDDALSVVVPVADAATGGRAAPNATRPGVVLTPVDPR